jgi:hypothetical protein
VPAHLVNIWLRGLRWRHLTEAVETIPRSTLVRGQAVGFMANNVFPLRVGEVLRAWYVARETNASGAQIFGTAHPERGIDTVGDRDGRFVLPLRRGRRRGAPRGALR